MQLVVVYHIISTIFFHPTPLQVRDRDLKIAKLNAQVESSRSHASACDPDAERGDYTIANLRAAIVSLEDSNQNLRAQLQGWFLAIVIYLDFIIFLSVDNYFLTFKMH